MIAAIGSAGSEVPHGICERCGEYMPHACPAEVIENYVKWTASWSRRPVVLDQHLARYLMEEAA